MERTWQLDQREQALVGQMEQERQQALAMVGALTLDMRNAEKQLESSAERQRAFVRQALMTRGIDRYENARLANGSLVVTVPDGPPLPPGPPPPLEAGAPDGEGVRPSFVPRPNGSE